VIDLLNMRWEHHILRVEFGVPGAHHVPRQPESVGDVFAMSHGFKEIEGNAILSVFTGKVTVHTEGFAEARHTHPDFVGSTLVPPRVVKHGVKRPDDFAPQYATGRRQLAIAKWRKHQRQFTRGHRPCCRWDIDFLRALR